MINSKSFIDEEESAMNISKRLLEMSCQAAIIKPRRVANSAWLGHVPFAFFILNVLKPRIFVELGTFKGVSYSAFCQSAEINDIKTNCYAVDTWVGDEHAGFYSDTVYDEFCKFHQKQPWEFSRLLRMDFDTALNEFGDGSVDLLHIDGYHTYEAVRHDYESWKPKLSDRAVVLFHDAATRKRDFGVWKFMEELKEERHFFMFAHSFGLGVLGHGTNLIEDAQNLFEAMKDPDVNAFMLDYYSKLGTMTDHLLQVRKLKQQLLDAKIETEKYKPDEKMRVGPVSAEP